MHTQCETEQQNESKLWQQNKTKKSWVHFSVTTELVSNHVTQDTFISTSQFIQDSRCLRRQMELIHTRMKRKERKKNLKHRHCTLCCLFSALQRCNSVSCPLKHVIFIVRPRYLCGSNCKHTKWQNINRTPVPNTMSFFIFLQRKLMRKGQTDNFVWRNHTDRHRRKALMRLEQTETASHRKKKNIHRKGEQIFIIK